jgi:hypothetical protein
LEKFGPIGVYQSIRTYGEFNYNAARVVRNLLAMDGWMLQTEAGRTMARERRQFNIDFAQSLAAAYEPYSIEPEEAK